MLASRADHHSVTADRLAGTADAVADLESPVVAELVEGEAVKFCFECHPDGISVGDPEATVDPERGGVFAFTDLRVYVRLGLADGDESVSLTYDDVTAADCHEGMRRHRIDLAAGGTTYHLWIPTAFDREDVARAAEYATYRHKQETPDEGGGTSDSGEPQSVRERLERLGDAKSRGLIDEEEFQRRKERLLEADESEDEAG
jgi:hypothetical protein